MNVQKALRLLGKPAYWRALRHGVGAGIEHEPLGKLIPEIRTVLDVGANRGQFSLVARRLWPAATIIAFEPQSQPAADFRSVFNKDRHIVLHEVAISPNAGHADIHVSRRDDSSSMLPILPQQEAVFPGTSESGTCVVRTARLDDLVAADILAPPVLLKLDVQGFELKVLESCGQLLARCDYVYAELSFMELYSGQALADDVIRFLHDRGFTFQAALNLVSDRAKRPVQGDFLFLRGISMAVARRA